MMKLGKNLLFVSTVLCLAGCRLVGLNEPKEAIYILPKGYFGPVVIVFDQQNGAEPSIEEGYRVYRIPSSGVLKTKVAATYNIDRLSFYEEDGDGIRTQIEYVYAASEGNLPGRERKTFENISETDGTKYVMGSEMGSFESRIGVVRFRAFQVGRVSESEKINAEIRSRILSIQKSL